ncbi:alpha-1,6-mannosyl-glycoprotein 2-beta-n-acetylglucosaminyltransferase [Plakobranchus ocellatus]|uniref:Alpha-1,6-mannosyl-glycoprotein 2-beta-N-acetylglucosaminyltransferase n=1 Tax=Plakobranchus ocellatus TaxID=259542 RepID=A0AAV3Y0R3_9GAST|nr:alpha-1,6-mannosyl-glycoprotein 2-beta-n-acetylglucosaminyltransferase [Plakobranchus ocellatus]
MRMSLRKALRWVLAFIMVVFVTLNLHLLYNTPESETTVVLNKRDSSEAVFPLAQAWVDMNGQDAAAGPPHDGQVRTTAKLSLVIPSKPSNISSSSALNNGTMSKKQRYNKYININDTETLKMEVLRINTEQYVHNLDRFGLSLGSDSLVIVIQAHDRPEHLRLLLNSMRKVKDISHSLLIVSHDVYSHQLNDLIEAVDFCPVMQIFFPFSQQIYSKEFPGEHPNDCPRNVKKSEALKKKCNNAEFPDRYGHYREAKYCQAKHHWIWKLQHVFEEIHILNNYEGNVMLLEDDYFLSEDILFSTHMLMGLKERDCPDCRMLVLGNYDKNQNYATNGAKVERTYWISSKHNMGMTFNRSLWLDLKNCAKEFCSFDDYNWDWTLQHLSMKCIPGRIRLLVMKASRIFHLGECGMHKKSKNCDPQAKVQQIETKLMQNYKHLYPNMVTVAGDSRIKLRDPKPNGGWGDIRDHNLCLKHFSNATDKYIR